MSQYIETRDIELNGGQVSVQGGYGERFLLVEALGPVDIIFTDQFQKEIGQAKGIQAGLSVAFEKPFSFAKITSNTNQTIKICFGSRNIEFNRLAGQISTDIKQGNTLTDTGQILDDTPSIVIMQDINNKRIVFTADKNNSGTIYLGGASVDPTQAAIQLEAGESYIEELCCGAEWYGVTDSTNIGDLLLINIGAMT